MHEVRFTHPRTRLVVLPLLLALLSPGCLSQPPEPTLLGEPDPGSFHLTAEPPLAPYFLSIRADEAGGPSRRNAQFDGGDQVVVDWSTLPLPQVKWIEVNGRDCEGTFGIKERAETDLLLILAGDVCRVEVLGTHPEGGPHHEPGE